MNFRLAFACLMLLSLTLIGCDEATPKKQHRSEPITVPGGHPTPMPPAVEVSEPQSENIGEMRTIPAAQGPRDAAPFVIDNLNKIRSAGGEKIMASVSAEVLSSYATGVYKNGGPTNPLIYFDPNAQTITVSWFIIRETYPYNQMDRALETFKSVVRYDKDLFDEENPQDPPMYIWKDGKREILSFDAYMDVVEINGERMVSIDAGAILESQADFHNKVPPQTHDWFYHNHLASWSFAHLSGFGGSGRDYPLMFGFLSKENTLIYVLNKDKAEKYPAAEMSEAFSVYRKYLDSRVK